MRRDEESLLSSKVAGANEGINPEQCTLDLSFYAGVSRHRGIREWVSQWLNEIIKSVDNNSSKSNNFIFIEGCNLIIYLNLPDERVS